MLIAPKAVKYSSSLDAARQIAAKEGVRSFFKGAGANILRGVAGAGVLSIYDQVRKSSLFNSDDPPYANCSQNCSCSAKPSREAPGKHLDISNYGEVAGGYAIQKTGVECDVVVRADNASLQESKTESNIDVQCEVLGVEHRSMGMSSLVEPVLYCLISLFPVVRHLLQKLYSLGVALHGSLNLIFNAFVPGARCLLAGYVRI